MKLIAYVIFDAKARIYNKPFYFVNSQVALRSATDLLSDTSTDIYRNPEDFSLWKIGEYNDETAEFTQCDHEIVARFHELDPNPRAPIFEIPKDEPEAQTA